MEADPEEDFHAVVQRAPEDPENVRGRVNDGLQRRREAHSTARGTLAEEAGPLQQEAACVCTAHGECAAGY